MREDGDLLFNEYDLHAVVDAQLKKMYEEIDAIEGNSLLSTNVEDQCDYYEDEYCINPIVLQEEQITVNQKETQIDVSHERQRYIRDRSRPFLIPGTSVAFFIPFEGDAFLFKCHPSASTSAPPFARVREQELVVLYSVAEHDGDAIRQRFDRELAKIKQSVGWIERDIKPFNEQLRSNARQRIDSRREKLLKDQGLVASLGFPLRRRTGSSPTYVTPTVRRKVTVTRPKPSVEPFQAEPVLEAKEYEHILKVVANMVAVIERSPEAFKGMKEEDLRQHFLVQLNGHYEGQATGETFNFEGKTDILIRVEGKNIFIAECKYWDGPKVLSDTIDQLLGYVSWRDTKTAILVFNRDRKLSTVLEKIPNILESHPNFKRGIKYDAETGFRYMLHHRDDTNRELVLTVLVFEVPA